MKSPASNPSVDQLAQVLWDYHRMGQDPVKSDAIFLLGSHDLRIAEHAAKLYTEGLAPLVIISGGVAHVNDLLGTNWNRSEAEVLGEVSRRGGVPASDLLLEKRATNTGENVLFTRQLLAEQGIDPQSFLLVQKPYMERRTYATFSKQWPGKRFRVTSPPISYEEYVSGPIPKDQIINLMVGDLQRISLYPGLGFQIPQHIPEKVWEAFERLTSLGYDKHLIQAT